MTVLTRERPYADVTAISISVRGGSRNEHDDTVGAAHFMEHMFFQGTPIAPDHRLGVRADQRARRLAERLHALREHQLPGASSRTRTFRWRSTTLADMLVNSLFAEDRIDKERQVVLEELIRGKNDPRRYAVELFFKNVWEDHPARNLPIGSRETLANSDRKVLMAFRDANFLARNMVTAVVGDQSHDAVVERITAAFERDAERRQADASRSAPFPAAKPRRIEETSPGTQAQVVRRAAGRRAPIIADTYALDIMSATLGEVGRRLVGEIRDERGLASSVGSSYSTLSDVGMLVGDGRDVAGQRGPGDRADPRGDAADADATPSRCSELEDAKSYIEGRAVLGLQTSIAFAQYLADREAIGVEPPLEEYLRRVASVTAEDVERVAQRLPRP